MSSPGNPGRFSGPRANISGMSRASPKHVLLVAYHYPPSTAAGAVRPAKFARYLPEHDWRVTVLSVAPPAHSAVPAEEGPNEVHRVRAWPHPQKIYERLKARAAHDEVAYRAVPARLRSPVRHVFASLSGRVFAWPKRSVLALCSLPDQEMDWLTPAVFRGVRLVRSKRITHMITTGPPHTCHLVGLAIKLLTGAHWVADFRDPWTNRGLGGKPPVEWNRDRLTNCVETRMRQWVMRTSDVVLSVTQPVTEHMRTEFPGLDPAKIITLTNGFDPADFAQFPQVRQFAHPVMFSYLGNFYGPRNPVTFLRALRTLLDDGSLSPGEVQARFVGVVGIAGGRPVPEMLRELGLESMVTVEPTVPRREALRLNLESDVALVLNEDWPHAVPSKLYDALASGTTILNIGSGGAVAEVLARTGRGIVVNHTDLDEIRGGILECVRRCRDPRYRRPPRPWEDPVIREFDYRVLTARLAALLEDLRS